MDVRDELGTDRALIGMVHLSPLPGAPRYEGPRGEIHERAIADARTLVTAGIDGLLVENYGDIPYYPDDVPDCVVAEMTAITRDLAREFETPIGVNVLRNDAVAAVSVAAASGGSFVRANVHTGAQVTDQGLLSGRAHETIRVRGNTDSDVAVLADLASKHAAPLSERRIGDLAVETVERGLADGLIVTGPATGEAVELADLQTVVDVRDEHGLDVPVFAGSGVTPETVEEVLSIADGGIVGTALKVDGRTTNPVDEARVRALVDAADRTD